MKKDTIYIDVEDDITAIIDKVKASKSKIVALVPPKRSAVLQSVVNMKLLKRTAGDIKKQVVLITNEPTAISLAGGVGLYVAKNLQSKPEIPAGPQDLNTDDPVIDGSEVELAADEAIGDLDDKHKGKDSSSSSGSKSSGSKSDKDKSSKDDKEKEPKTKEEKKAEKKNKIPDFSKFRNKLFLVFGGILLLIFLWWLFFMRLPSATITIKAQTSKVNTNVQFTADTALQESNIDEGQLKAERKELQKTVSESFVATGEKNIGDKASGEVTILNCDSSSSVVIPAGTTLTSSGLNFTLDKAVTVPGGSFSGGGCSSPGQADGDITATEPGDQYNLGEGSKYSVSGVSSLITARGEQLSGGTTENVKVVSQQDVDTARDNILSSDQTGGQAELEELFGDEIIPLDASFEVTPGDVSSSPAVGERADNGQITVMFTYSMVGVSSEDMTQLLENYQKSQIDESTQSIYENGLLNAEYSLDQKNSATSMVFTARTDGYVGPTIETENLAEEVSGKKYGEVVDIVKQRPGVNEVEVDFSPFYVNKAPKASRINIVLEVSEENLQ